MKPSLRGPSRFFSVLGCGLALAGSLAGPALGQAKQTAEQSFAQWASEAWRTAKLEHVRLSTPNNQLLLLRGEKIRRVGRTTYAEGNVSLEIGGLRLDCQSLEYDPDTGWAHARGECLFFWGENYACAETVDIDTLKNTAVMRHVSGRGEDLATNAKQVEEPLYFWAEELKWQPDKIEMNQAVISTCDLVPGDWHYRLEAEKIEVYPRDHLDATRSSVTMGNTRLVTLPIITVALDGKRGMLRDFIPSAGYNGLYGAFLRLKFPFTFDKNNFGRFRVDLYSVTGVAYGFEDTFSLGTKGGGNIYYYRQAGVGDATGRLDFHTNVGYQLDRYTSLGFSYGQNRTELPGLTSPLNIGTSVALTRNAPGSMIQLSSSYSRSGDNTNTGYRAYYEKDLSERDTILLSVDYSQASTLAARTQRYHYLADFIHRDTWFDAEAVFENSQGQSTFFLNREPEVRFRTRPLYVGMVPFVATASYGSITESPSNVHTERGDIRLFIPDQTIDWGSGRVQAGAGFRELFYGTQDAERVVTARTSVMQNLGPNCLARVDANIQLPSGTTPFQSDQLYSYESITGGLEFYNTGKFRLAGYGGYDLLHHQAHDVVARADYSLGPGWSVSSGANYDLVGGQFRSVDTQLSLQLSDKIYLSYWTVYDFTLQKQSYQDVLLKFSEHDWDASVAYRGVQNEVFVQFSMKAFPQPAIKVGPNTSSPILPQNLPNAFVR